MSIVVYMGSFINTVRYLNTNQKGIQPHISESTGSIKGDVCFLIIDLYLPFLGVLLWVMRISCAG